MTARPEPRQFASIRDRIGRRETGAERRAFERVRRAEVKYSASLRQVARHVGQVARAFGPDFEQLGGLRAVLARYAEALRPWAEVTAAKMLNDVQRRDEAAWSEIASTMSAEIGREIRSAPTGAALREMLGLQVDLITSLPREAGERVHLLALKGMETGARADVIVAELMRTGEVAEGRARTIARTEVSRASSNLVQARAAHVGSEGYTWETSRDPDVRRSHRAMQGKFVRWDAPPTLDGLTGHAGCLPNCRCWPRPVIPDPAF